MAVENEVSSSVGITKRNKTIRANTAGISSKGNPDSTSNQEPGQVISDTEVETEPSSLAEVQHTAGGNGTTSVSSSYQDLVLAIDNKVITARGNARFNQVKSLLAVHVDGRFSCKV